MSETPKPPEELPAKLRREYRQSIYRVGFEGRVFEMHVDIPSRDLREVFAARQVQSAAFLTAWNPLSKPLERDENNERNEELREALRRLGLQWLEAEGASADSDWKEKSLLILGIELPQARELAREYGQNAFLFATADAIPRLIFTEDGS